LSNAKQWSLTVSWDEGKYFPQYILTEVLCLKSSCFSMWLFYFSPCYPGRRGFLLFPFFFYQQHSLWSSDIELQNNKQKGSPLVITYEINFQTISGLWHLPNMSFLVTNHRDDNLDDDSNLINILPKGITINLWQPSIKDSWIQPMRITTIILTGDLKVDFIVAAVTTRKFPSCLLLNTLMQWILSGEKNIKETLWKLG